MTNIIRDIILLVLMCLFMALIATIPSEAMGQELLKDPDLEQGANHFISSAPSCSANLGTSKSRWIFVDICDRGCFCDGTVLAKDPGYHVYDTPTKSFTVDDGELTMEIDTGEETHAGCDLKKPGGNSYNVGKTHGWNHYFVNQLVYRPFANYHRMVMSFDVKLDYIEKTGGWCENEPNQLLLKMDWKVTSDKWPGFYVVYQLAAAKANNQIRMSVTPFLGGDPVGERVYIIPSNNRRKGTSIGQWVHFDLDITELTREALAAQRQAGLDVGPIDDYRLHVIGPSYEIWGGYASMVHFRNMSLTGHLDPEIPNYTELFRYWSPLAKNHFATPAYLPAGFGSYQYEGYLGSISSTPAEGTVPIYSYYNQEKVDHFYSTGLWPLGAGYDPAQCTFPRLADKTWCGKWKYEGILGYGWVEDGDYRRPVYQNYRADWVDHMLATVPWAGESAGYTGTGVPFFYLED